MDQYILRSFIEWLHEATHTDQQSLPSAKLSQAIANDASSRGHLIMLLAELFDIPASDTIVSALQCQEDLPAFIDLQIHEGLFAAVHEYPHVWWQLWVDPELDETYRVTLQLTQAEQVGTLPALRLSEEYSQQHRSGTVAQIGVSKSFLSQVLAEPRLLAMECGSPTGQAFLINTDDTEFLLSLRVLQQAGSPQTLLVNIAPPIAGRVISTLDTIVQEVPFDAHGRAAIENVIFTNGTEHADLNLEVSIDIDEPLL